MNISPIQLKFYTISRVSIVPREPVSINPRKESAELFDWSGVNIHTNVEFGWGDSPTEGSKPFALRLGLKTDNEIGKGTPYLIDLELIGYFDLIGKIPPDVVPQDLAQVNAAALLYSAMRELLFSQTIRFPHGPMVLPGVNFLELKGKTQETALADEAADGKNISGKT